MALPRHARRPGTARTVEAVFLPGLRRPLAEEIRQLLPEASRPEPVPGRDDALRFRHVGPFGRLHLLRTAVAVFVVLTFGVARPASLLHRDHLRRIATAVTAVRRCNRDAPPRSFRIEAAGRDSAVFRRLASELEEATGLPYQPGSGELVLRFHRSPGAAEGWDVLVRTSTRPLSARPWRVADYRGAVNATIAAAMVRMTGVRRDDRVLNLMSGSGTLLIERLLAGPARAAVGIDASEEATVACAANLDAAGLSDRVELLTADIGEPGVLDGRRFEVLLADPPWGTLTGSHTTNEAVYEAMLRTASVLAAPRARFAVLTHEVKLMDRLLKRHRYPWRAREVHRVFQKGHHPRIYLLEQ